MGAKSNRNDQRLTKPCFGTAWKTVPDLQGCATFQSSNWVMFLFLSTQKLIYNKMICTQPNRYVCIAFRHFCPYLFHCFCHCHIHWVHQLNCNSQMTLLTHTLEVWRPSNVLAIASKTVWLESRRQYLISCDRAVVDANGRQRYAYAYGTPHGHGDGDSIGRTSNTFLVWLSLLHWIDLLLYF